MSSWKKASKTNQKTHRERSQPQARQHLGLLEKKKDYQLRSRDTHEKEDTLKLLRKRAQNRNPDEFYHHMINSKIDDGEHREKDKGDDHTPAQIHLMQTQDQKYINMKHTIEVNKIKRLQGELHMIDAANTIPNKHTFFLDTDEERANFDLAKRLKTHPALLQRRTNRPKLSDLAKMNLPSIDQDTVKLMTKQRENSYKELNSRIDRERELSVIQQKMQLKRALQEKRALKPKRIAAGTKNSAPIYKFKYERKK